ncbi:type I toxin-antitoxin system Ibs family toxin [Shigella flexneri]
MMKFVIILVVSLLLSFPLLY